MEDGLVRIARLLWGSTAGNQSLHRPSMVVEVGFYDEDDSDDEVDDMEFHNSDAYFGVSQDDTGLLAIAKASFNKWYSSTMQFKQEEDRSHKWHTNRQSNDHDNPPAKGQSSEPYSGDTISINSKKFSADFSKETSEDYSRLKATNANPESIESGKHVVDVTDPTSEKSWKAVSQHVSGNENTENYDQQLINTNLGVEEPSWLIVSVDDAETEDDIDERSDASPRNCNDNNHRTTQGNCGNCINQNDFVEEVAHNIDTKSAPATTEAITCSGMGCTEMPVYEMGDSEKSYKVGDFDPATVLVQESIKTLDGKLHVDSNEHVSEVQILQLHNPQLANTNDENGPVNQDVVLRNDESKNDRSPATNQIPDTNRSPKYCYKFSGNPPRNVFNFGSKKNNACGNMSTVCKLTYSDHDKCVCSNSHTNGRNGSKFQQTIVNAQLRVQDDRMNQGSPPFEESPPGAHTSSFTASVDSQTVGATPTGHTAPKEDVVATTKAQSSTTSKGTDFDSTGAGLKTKSAFLVSHLRSRLAELEKRSSLMDVYVNTLSQRTIKLERETRSLLQNIRSETAEDLAVAERLANEFQHLSRHVQSLSRAVVICIAACGALTVGLFLSVLLVSVRIQYAFLGKC